MSCTLATPHSHEKGAILIFGAFAIAAILMLLALAIDLSILSISAEQTRNHARMVSLAALEAYMASDKATEPEKKADALARANEVAQLNTAIFSGQATNTLGSANGPQLIAGKISYTPSDCGGNAPCFLDLANSSEKSNAFMVKGQLHQGIATRFASIFGFGEDYKLEAEQIAAVTPRRGCFLVDLSPSMVRETHPNTEYAYDLNNANHLSQYNALPPARIGTSPNTVHYKNDYQLAMTYKDSDYGGVLAHHHPNPSKYSSSAKFGSSNYAIDTYRSNNYRGPEPLATVFQGLASAFQLFKARSVAGDKACIIFYDDSLTWQRIINLTDDFDYLEKFTDLKVYSSNGVLDTTKGAGLLAKHGIFPARDSKTDTRKAIIEALNQFETAKANNPNLITSDFMVHIGDGITNCSACKGYEELMPKYDLNGDGQWNKGDADNFKLCLDRYANGGSLTGPYQKCAPNNSPNLLDINGDGAINLDDYTFIKSHLPDNQGNIGCYISGCNNDSLHYFFATTALHNIVASRVIPASIPIHVIQVGRHVAPHTVDIASDDGTKCLTDSQIREKLTTLIPQGKSPINSADIHGHYDEPALDFNWFNEYFNKTSKEFPFFYSNGEMYKVALATGGLWGPLRPSSSSCTKKECDLSSPRRLEDPLCRSTENQIKDYMKLIMGQNPYRIVSFGH